MRGGKQLGILRGGEESVAGPWQPGYPGLQCLKTTPAPQSLSLQHATTLKAREESTPSSTSTLENVVAWSRARSSVRCRFPH